MSHQGEHVYDCIVVGAGIEGSATAYHLAKEHRNTLLLEQFGLPHTRGSSHGQSRITRFSYSENHYMRMMEEAFPLWSTLEKETNTTLFKETGLLIIQKPPYHLYEERREQLVRCGKPFVELTHRELRRRYPGMRLSGDYKAMLDTSAGTLRADKGLKGFQDVFKQRGGIICDEEQVLRIIPGKPVTVITNKGQHLARSIVITAGPWSSKLLQPLGLNLPLEVWRINVCYWKDKYGQFRDFPCFLDDTTGKKHIYGLPVHEYPGLFKMCYHSGSVVDPDARDKAVSPSDIEVVQNLINNYFPGLDGSEPAIVESCMYTVTPDWNFVLDTHPEHSNIVIGCGFSGHGFKLSPVVGKILSELATGRATSYDISPLSIKRFGQRAICKGKL